MDEFKEWLEKQGFRFQHNGLRYEHNLCDWIAYRKTNLEVVPCETNEGKGMQIIVNGFFTKIGEVTHRSAEVEVVGEQMGTWWTLKAYSLTPEEVMNGLPEIEESLISAWNALRGTR